MERCPALKTTTTVEPFANGNKDLKDVLLKSSQRHDNATLFALI